MTVEPASTRVNRINSDSLDWSYIGISVTVEHFEERAACGGRSTADPPSIPNRWPQMARALRQLGRFHLRGPRQGLRVDVLPDARQSAVPDRDGEDPVVLERLVRGFDLPPGKADD